MAVRNDIILFPTIDVSFMSYCENAVVICCENENIISWKKAYKLVPNLFATLIQAKRYFY